MDFFYEHPVFRYEEFRDAHQASGERSPLTTTSVLAQHVASGRLIHVRRGVYGVGRALPRGAAAHVDPFIVAGKLARDAVVAYHAALQFRGVAYSIWHRYAVLSRSLPRRFLWGHNEFVGVAPPAAVRDLPDFGGGITCEHYAGAMVRVTSVERTLVDVLDRPRLGGGWEEVWRSLEMVEFVDLDVVVAYTTKLGTALTAARVGYFLESHRDQLFVEDRHFNTLREMVPKQPRYMDGSRAPGRLVKPWNIIVPEAVLGRTWEEPLYDEC